MVQDPEFLLYDNYSALPSYWNDPSDACRNSQNQDSVPLATLRQLSFNCRVNSTTGWLDNTSFQVTAKGTTNTWSQIYGEEIEVKPNERYELVAHMKLNDAATNSRISIETYNETSKNWQQIKQCPSGIDGPLEWAQFSCDVTIPESVSKMRVVLNAGWSSREDESSTTFFDAIYMYKLKMKAQNFKILIKLKK